MTEAVKLDDLDEEIINFLVENSRISNRAIARELGLSESGIRKRLKRMIEGNVISYGLIVDGSSTGMTSSGWLSIRCHPRMARKIAHEVTILGQCTLCALSTGRYNIRVYIFAETAIAMAEIYQKILDLDGVIEANFRPLARSALHRYEYIILSEREHVERWGVISPPGPTAASASK